MDLRRENASGHTVLPYVARPAPRRDLPVEGGWQPRPGDRTVRRQRLRLRRLRRILGIPQLFSAAYAHSGSVYYALGMVAVASLAATPASIGIAAILFIITSLTYAEGMSMFPEAGGSSALARHAFNERIGFASGWALMLSYIATIAIAPYTIPAYLGYFWEPLRVHPGEVSVLGTTISVGIVFVIMLANIVGLRESAIIRFTSTLLDIAIQISIVLLGLALIFGPNPAILIRHIAAQGSWPGTQDIIFGVALVALSFIGLETVSQLAEETRHPQIRVPRTLKLTTITLLLLFAGLMVVSLSAMTPDELANEWSRAPIAGIVAKFPVEALRQVYGAAVALVASIILLLATNAGLLGVSRLAYAQGKRVPALSLCSHIHRRFGTPLFSIALPCIVAMLLLLPGYLHGDFFEHLGALYAFGALISFSFAHASIIVLRFKQPNLPRSYKLPLNVRWRRISIPLPAIVGLTGTVIIWFMVVATQPPITVIGFGWMLIGLLVYSLRRQRKTAPQPGQPAAPQQS